jgi:isopentenyl diphosphate isomerase/L-lactate dehydrogenase-like FMN-dependent dehydrogenase
MEPINLFDYERLAQERLDPAIWEHIYGGSEDEVTLRANRTAFEHLRLRPRVLVDVSTIDMHTSVLGTPISMPIGIAPSAGHQIVVPEGEYATARAAEQAKTLMIISCFASRTVEEIASITTGPLWLQLYTHRGLEISCRLVQRAENAGYRAVVLTVDTAHLGRRERDIRNNFQRTQHTPLVNFVETHTTSMAPMAPIQLNHLIDTWETVDLLRSITKLPILLKGILTAEDALLAVERGVDGIIVSNHGGRQLDGALASIEALPEIAHVVAGRCEIYLDGGVRRGTDVLKALALGARAVFLGRPILWGLAVDGETGAKHVLEIMRHELHMAMTLAGRPDLAAIDRSLVKS